MAPQPRRLLLQSLAQSGLGVNAIVPATACHSPKEISDEQIDACRKCVFEQIRKIQGSAVLTVGAGALKSLKIGEGKKNVTSEHGIPFWHPEISRWVVPTFAPGAILREPDRFRDYTSDLDALSRVVNSPPGPRVEDPPPRPIEIRSPEQLRKILPKLKRSRMSVDIETTGLEPKFSKVAFLGLSVAKDSAYIFDEDSIRRCQPLLADLFGSHSDTVGHNAGQFDAKFLYHHFGFDWRPRYDTMFLHYCVDERQIGHGLEALSRRYLDAEPWKIDIVAAIADPTQRQTVMQYLARDCSHTLQLVDPLLDEVEREGTLQVHDRFLVPGSVAIGRVELGGVTIDRPYLESLGGVFQKKYESLLERIQQVIDDANFNPNSPKQVAEVLFDRLKIPHRKRSTDYETLSSMSHPVAKLILEARQALRFNSTYVKGILDRLGPDGRIYADFMLFGTVTGRLSCRNPNLQNIPQISEEGRLVRDAFIPSRPGWVLIEADYSQLELRMAAYITGDKKLIDTYRRGLDVHRMVAAEVFNVPPEKVTYEQRYIAKYIDFGILYGRQAASLAHGELNCSVAKAQSYIDRFLGQYKELGHWIRSQQDRAVEVGYVVGPTGRKRRFPLVTPANVHGIKNQSVNTPIQGAASDVCLTALTRLQMEALDLDRCRPLLTVHDSILFECDPDSVEEACEVIKNVMEDVPLPDSPIPFKAEVKTAARWGGTK